MMRALCAAVLAATLAVPPTPQTASMAAMTYVRVVRPRIVWRPIPFGERRRHEMGAYSRRHHGRWAWRLAEPNVIVEHYADGTIDQLVNLRVRCRHAIGMNWTAIGIEHVGTSDRKILTHPH